MLKFFIVSITFAICLNSYFFIDQVLADDIDDGLVISQVQIGDVSHSRFVELFNNSDYPIDVTNWCVYHSSASGITKTKLVCFTDENDLNHLLVAAKSYILISSPQTQLDGDYLMAKGLGGVSGGHVYVIDSQKVERDSVGWGELGVNSEGSAAVIGDENIDYILERKQISNNYYQDTNNNQQDFTDSSFRSKYLIGSISEVSDVCRNIDGIQVLVPDGYDYYENSNCLPLPVDVCQNIDGLQIYAPDGYLVDGGGNCIIDTCANLDGLQAILPEDYIINDEGFCVLSLQPLVINEILPNPDGNDDGNEFIEIFNPNDSDVVLDNYQLIVVSASSNKQYDLPAGLIIPAGKYLALYDDEVGFTLVNTSMAIELWSIDGAVVDSSVVYENPASGSAWVLINDNWQFTNRPTPGSVNLSSLVTIQPANVISPDSELEPCAPNQYRNPETNRCKLIQSIESSLVPCKEGQYRSEETNRCRSIAGDVASYVPCAEGQERNPATNRCRSIVLASSTDGLVPCKEGQERNPETNRCRNIVLASVPQVDYAPDPVAIDTGNYAFLLSLTGLGTLAVIYGLWEWRHEIGSIFKNMNLHFLKRK